MKFIIKNLLNTLCICYSNTIKPEGTLLEKQTDSHPKNLNTS